MQDAKYKKKNNDYQRKLSTERARSIIRQERKTRRSFCELVLPRPGLWLRAAGQAAIHVLCADDVLGRHEVCQCCDRSHGGTGVNMVGPHVAAVNRIETRIIGLCKQLELVQNSSAHSERIGVGRVIVNNALQDQQNLYAFCEREEVTVVVGTGHRIPDVRWDAVEQ